MGAATNALQGIVPALVTPFRADERIDFGAWQRIIDALISSGVHGLFAAGGQGEFFALEPEERTVALRFCVQYVAGRVPVYGNVGAVTTRETVKLAQQAEAEGVPYLVVITPYYLRPTAEELADHFIEICRAVRVPVLAYNIPERTGVDMTTAVVARVAAACENFVGLKDSSGKLDRIPELVGAAGGRPFAVFIGRDHMILPALKLGCAGAVAACANVAPRLFVDLYKAFRAGDLDTAARLQALADPLREAFGLHTFPSVIKAAMEMIGLPAGPCRKPVGPMPPAARAELAAVLEKLRTENYLPQTVGQASRPVRIMHTNRLANESSPYLLEHAHNPVDWYPWGPEAFAKARSEEKPIFLSIGYSTCHWCHVMERESFENESIAAILNRAFVPIKVDREERPDVDRVYMTFVQATTGSGGWPMSVWLTPDLQPFFGGTYFPPSDRAGHAGFATVLERVAEAWREERDKIVESSIDVVEQLRRHIEQPQPSAAGRLDQNALSSGFQIFRRGYDARHGGFGGAPRFPQPSIFNFLLRYHARTGSAEARDMVLGTLDALVAGGVHDQLGGGFHRYAVDEDWRVPHFEKMLYDQAQLAVSFVEAFQITGNPEYARAARRTLDYVLRDMRDPEGGFYSAEDADSVIDPSRPETKGEGAFYLWTPAQVREIAGEPACDWFSYRYGVEEGGNAAAADPHGEFTGKSILYRAHTVEETARRFERPVAEVGAGIAEAEHKLLEERAVRIRPHLDDKVLAAWNGLMITALARAGAALDEPAYTEAAARAAGFIAARMYDPASGILLRRYRKGDAAIQGFLDDYAFLTQGLLDLYEAGFDLRWLRLGVALAAKQRELFEDPVHGGFFSAPADPALVIRAKEDYDGAEPSGNSIAVMNLLRLARMTDRADFLQSAEKALDAFANRILGMPAGLPQMLAACEFYLDQPREIVVAGDSASEDTRELLRIVHSRFLPSKVLLLAHGGELAAYHPAVAAMGRKDGRATAYVCRNYACELPTSDPARFAELLQ